MTITSLAASSSPGVAPATNVASIRRPRASRAPFRARASAEDATDSAETAQSATFTNEGAFKALGDLSASASTKASSPFGGSNANAANPFAAATAAPAAAPVGFVADGVDPASLPVKGDADRLLIRFDREQRRGELPDESTPEGSPQCTHPPLRASCRALASASSRVMMGICAPDAVGGIAALKAWTGDLGLPRGKLHGLDVDGEPVDPPEGPVFVKYNSDSGDAFLSGYGGEYRGVLFTPELGDGAFRQYGYLPLDLPAGGKR